MYVHEIYYLSVGRVRGKALKLVLYSLRVYSSSLITICQFEFLKTMHASWHYIFNTGPQSLSIDVLFSDAFLLKKEQNIYIFGTLIYQH